MKFMKFGKALLTSALSAGVMLSLTSCVQSYTVGYLYVTGTVTTGTGSEVGNGRITGFAIDHNTGKLTAMHGLPVNSGGANPVRAILTNDSRFLYVLNRGANSDGGDCTTGDACQNPNITEFAVGGNGILTPEGTFLTQGVNPFRLIADSTGTHLYVLDHDAPDSAAITHVTPTLANPNSCMLADNTTISCGDITGFTIDQTTGHLSPLVNAGIATLTGKQISYFPVPSNPVDFVLSGSYLFTLNSAAAQTSYPYVGGATVYPYKYNAGQLIAFTTSQILNDSNGPLSNGTAIVSGGEVVYVLDNNPTGSQILPFTSITNGLLNAASIVFDDVNESDPINLLVEAKGKWFYVANDEGASQSTAASGIAGYVINSSPFQPTEMPGSPFGTGAGPQCLVEDPSNQFIYTANGDSTVTAKSLDENAGLLVPLNQSTKASASYLLTGPATWCLVDGRTN